MPHSDSAVVTATATAAPAPTIPAAQDRLVYSARTRTGASHNVANQTLQAARRAGAPTIHTNPPSSIAEARQMATEFNRDPVRRASDAAHAGARLMLASGGARACVQTLIYSHTAGDGWLLDGARLASSVAYHLLRAADTITVEWPEGAEATATPAAVPRIAPRRPIRPDAKV